MNSPTQPRILTIDGPAGAGKSTVARQVAQVLGGRVLDTGALYRAVGLALHDQGLEPDAFAPPHAPGNSSGISATPLDNLLASLNIRADTDAAGTSRVWINDDELTTRLRSPEASRLASRFAALPAVRQRLLPIQRDWAAQPGAAWVVAEGRDMGSVVFPQADVKIFLTAGVETRARRRHAELSAAGTAVDFATLCHDIAERDRRDQERSEAPLRPAPDAVEIDSDGLSPQGVVDHILRVVAARASSGR